MDFLNAYTFGFCEKRGFTKGSAWKELLEAEGVLFTDETHVDMARFRVPFLPLIG